MECRKIQEWLLGDYFDRRCSPDRRKNIDEHISRCNACRDFLANLEQAARFPFRNAPELEPPEAVWHNIKEEITLGKISLKDRFDYFCSGLISFFTVPKLVAAGVTFALMISLTVFSQRRITRQNYEVGESIHEAAQFLASLDSDRLGETDTVENEAADNFL